MKVSIHIFSLSICISTALVLMCPSSTRAQLAEKHYTAFWVNGGLGRSSLGSFAESANVSFQYEKFLVSFRTTESNESLLGGTTLHDLGLLIGYTSMRTEWHSSIAVGIAMVSGNRDNSSLFSPGGIENRHNIPPKIGLPLEAQLFIKSNAFIGIGVYIYANINAVQSFGGITFCLQFGKLR